MSAHTPETRAKMSASRLGKTQSPETREKIGIGARHPLARDFTTEQFAEYQFLKRNKHLTTDEAVSLIKTGAMPKRKNNAPY